MAYDYEKSKKLYESLSPEKQQEFAKDTSGNVQRFLSEYNAAQNKSQTNQTSNTSNSSSTPVNNSITNKTEYQGTGGSTKDVSSNPYVNQGNGDYSYNPKSGYYEINKSGGTNTGTSTPVDSTTSTNSNYAKIRDAWDKLSYKEQQAKLKENPSLKAGVEKVGGTFKTADETPTEDNTGSKDFTGKTANGDWDYQDNSPERMAQMAYNVDQIYQTNPGIFASEDSFRNFFIDGKGRTPEQEKFLMDYYKNRKTYNEYDGYTSEAVGSMYAYGKVPESYLNYVKTSNPQRYAEIMDAKDKEQDKIKNNSSYDSILEQNGFESTNNLDWQKREGLLVDKNNDLIDDRLYHEPTEEERQKVDRINEIDARMLEINNALKWAEEDLTKAYPGATKATIMALVNDRSQNLLREKDDLMVERTQLAGTVDYLQNERQQQDDAGYKTIAQLQKNLGMYYDYTPEGMSELAQAQYAATNVTLDQAENGTDTQKQMALDRVLSDYYDKYGSIIQRSKSQVINDVMAYAKKNGVSLSQALEDNFLSQLRKKPGFDALNTVESKDPYVVKVGDVAYRYNPETDEFELIGGNGTIGGALGGGTTNGELYGFTNYTPITTEKKESILDSFMSDHPLNSDGGECGSFVNDYLQSLGYNRLYDDPIDKKKAVTNSDTATKGSIAVLDSKKYPQYGHTAIITDVQGDKVKLLESNWNDDHQVHERWVNKSEVLGYFDPSKEPTPATAINQNGKYGNKSNWNPDGYSNNLTGEYEAYLADPTYENNTDFKYKLGEFGISFEDFTEQAKNYARTGMKDSQVDSASNALEAAINLYEYVNGNKSTLLGANDSKQGGLFDWLGGYVPKLGGDAYDAKGYYDTLGDRLTLDKLIETKKQGATYGAMSEGEWKLLKNAATSLDWGSSSDKFQKNLEDLIWTLTRTVYEGGGKLPSNFANSAASKYVLESGKSGKYNPYLKDNTPMNYNSNNTAPSRLS